MKLALDQIEFSAAIQVRVKIDQKIVDEYADAIESGAAFPPLVVFAPKNSQRYICADGFHRGAALLKIGRKTVGVDVHEGDVHEALHYALSANSAHGIRRTSADKTNAVQLALKDPNYDDLSLRELSELCRVSHELVRRIKESQNEDKKKVTPRPRKPPPSQNEMDANELRGAIATITRFAYDGKAAYARLQLVSEIDSLVLAGNWLREAIDEHDRQ